MVTPVDQQYAQFKDEDLTPFLYDVPSQVLRNGAVRFMGPCSAFGMGWPSGQPTKEIRPSNRMVHVCQTCGFTENADFNSSLVIKKKGIRMLVADELSVKHKEACHAVKEKAAPRVGTARSNARGDGCKPS
jgi:transposase